MPLVGTLSTMPLTDLLQWLGGSRRTGVLEVERAKVKKRVVFRDGRVIACWTGEPTELLGHFLVSHGKISEDTLRGALASHEASGQPLGTILVSMGALSSAELTRHLAAKAEETIVSLFDLEDAVFRFERGEASAESVSFPVDLRVEDILLRGLQRLDETRQIRTVFNDPGIVLRRAPRRPPPELSSNRMARRIYESINGERTVAEILLHAHGSEFLVTRFLFELFRSGFVEIKETRDLPDEALPAPRAGRSPARDNGTPRGSAAAPQAPAEPARRPPASPRAAAAAARPAATSVSDPRSETPTGETSLQDDLEVAGKLMTRGEYDAALEILNGTYRAHPDDKTLGRLLAEAEACFVEKAYRHYLPADRVPILKRSPEELASERISPEEYFLLSQVDGTWDVKSIIQISPIREVDALRALKRMREKGFIDLRDAE